MPTKLYVDDDIDDILFLKEAFFVNDPSIKFIESRNSVEALQYLESIKLILSYFPSLIIMDINMPMMDGRMTIKHIKNDPALQSIPIVAFTTSNNPMDKMICQQMGVNCVLKPNSAAELKDVANNFLFTYIYSN